MFCTLPQLLAAPKLRKTRVMIPMTSRTSEVLTSMPEAVLPGEQKPLYGHTS